LNVFKENGINVVHIESRRSRRVNSEYEIYVDLEADCHRVQESMKQLQRQVSCVRVDLNHFADLTDFVNENTNDSVDKADVELPPTSPFLDQHGQPINRRSKSHSSNTYYCQAYPCGMHRNCHN
jgi:hypothetical protein